MIVFDISVGRHHLGALGIIMFLVFMAVSGLGLAYLEMRFKLSTYLAILILVVAAIAATLVIQHGYIP